MIVLLDSAGNPDYGQDPARPFLYCEKSKAVEVGSLKEASERCSQFIDANNLGGGNWVGGQVFDGDFLIAEVSYNGRVWSTTPERTEVIF